MGLAGDDGDVLEVGVIVPDDRAVVLRDGRGDQVDHARGPVLPAGGSSLFGVLVGLACLAGDAVRRHGRVP